MQNAFTSLLKCKWPLVGPAMATAAGGRLAVAVTKGGGFGFISSSYQTLEWFKDQLDLVRRDLGTSAQRLPIGCGYLLWTLDDKPREEAEALVELGIKHSSAIWLAFGDSLQRWFTFVRERADPKDVRVFVVVSTVGEAVAAARLKPDVLVAQGIEAGGHGNGSSPPLLTLIPMILDALPAEDRPLIVAAGGLVTGHQVAAVLALGADAAALGTRLVAAPESLYNDAQRQALVAAKGNATVRSMVFDEMRGTLGWPKGIDGRALMNKTYHEAMDGRSKDELKKDFDAATKAQDTSRSLVWAGASVGLIDRVQPAQEIMEEVGQQAVACLKRVQC